MLKPASIILVIGDYHFVFIRGGNVVRSVGVGLRLVGRKLAFICYFDWACSVEEVLVV